MSKYWIGIKDAPGYEINDTGEVRNRDTKRILSPHFNRPGGYKRVTIDGKKRYIHRLVADNFFGCGVKNSDKVIHIDGNFCNNSPKNLRIIDKKA